jgi:signal transduction histidine kinase
MSSVPPFGEPSTFLADIDPNPLVVLGQDRRILYANAAARALSAPQNGDCIEGRKLGEVLRCVHSEEPEGCGDTPACMYCGANLAIRLGLGGTPSTQECRVTATTADGDNSLEYSIQSRPVEWNGEQAVFCALNDISSEKRRRVLERTFFHDILNTAGSVKGLSEILLLERQAMGSEELADLLRMMRDICNVMLDEIRSQQLLLAAESGHLTTDWKQITIAECMADAVMVASHWPVAASKRIVPEYPAGRMMFVSDPVLLGRVLMNLMKNALEATSDGGEVRLGCRPVDDRVEFFVWNAGAIPDAIRSQIFQRSFSTKGTGRGTGTYSVRLFAEVYLKGKVSFACSQRDGTTFTVSFPLESPVQLSAGA